MYAYSSGGSSGGNNMLYGGPLGTYLSGLYNTPSSKSTSSSAASRRSRNYLGTTPTSYSGSSTNSSSYYTPQPRRKFGTHDSPSSDTTASRYGTSIYDHSNDRDSSRSRPSSSYYSPSSYSRPSSSTTSSYLTPYVSSVGNSVSPEPQSIDYKKLYEEEKRNTDKLRIDLDAIAKDISENISIADKLRRGGRRASIDQRRIERKLSEYEEEIKRGEDLQRETDKLRAENEALAKVVTRLSRGK